MISRRKFLALGAAVGAGLFVPHEWIGQLRPTFAQGRTPLDPRSLTQYIDPLPIPGPMPTAGANYYEVGMYQLSQQLHSQLPPTTVWGYGSSAATASYPAATFEVRRGVPIQVKWKNELHGVTHPLAVDPTLHWANPNDDTPPAPPIPPGFAYTLSNVPVSPHVHGGEQEPQSDGGPDAWFTPGFAIKGHGWQQEVYNYANEQPPATLWYHDHALGITRLNVYMGLAGYYIIRDPGNEPAGLPSGAYEVPLAIQDRMFDTDGQLLFPDLGINPDIHPFWIPEFVGDTILVNGKVWPYLNVEQRKYRFRILNGSNARFYELFIENVSGGKAAPIFRQIGTDGGYLNRPVNVPLLIMGPGERADVVVDFSAFPVGTEFLIRNSARTPYPNGVKPNLRTTGQIMKLRVVRRVGTDASVVPATLNPSLAAYPTLTTPTVIRTLTLNEVMGAGGPLEVLLNGTKWHAPSTENPVAGATELWEVVNMTADTHPMHWHLAQVQVVNRQRYKIAQYTAAFEAANPILPIPHMSNYAPVSVTPYLRGFATPPDANERGWKDTIRMNPGEVTRILVRFAPIGEASATPYPFDATAEPGYVWHCHIVDHEDNEMMRPLKVQPAAPVAPARPAIDSAPTFEP